MSPDQVELLKQFILREMDAIKTAAAETREESSKDHDEVKASIRGVGAKLDHVSERVQSLEVNDQARLKSLTSIHRLVLLVIAMIPVGFLIADHLTR